MALRWREIKNDSDEVVARRIKPSDLKGITSTDIVVGPNEAAVIMKNGKIDDVITQSKQRKFGEGLLKRFKNKIFGSEHYEILFVDTSPIDVTGKIRNIATKDNVRQDATCMLRFQVDMNNAQNFLNLIKSKDKLTTDEIREKVSDEINANAFSPYIHRHTIDEFRGDTKIQDEIEESVMTDMRKTFDMWGMNLINLATKWHISQHEKVERKEKEAELEEREKDIDTERKKSEIEREYDVKSKKEQKQYDQRDQHLEHKQDLDWKEIQFERTKEKTGVEHEEEKKDIKTDHSLERKDKQHKQKMTPEEREWEQDKKEMEKALEWKDKLNQQKMEREEHETELEIEKFQGTELKGKKVDADVEKTKAEMEAEKAKHNMETYKEAEDREREHRKDMMDKEAKLMESAKQDVPNTLVQGTDRTSTSIESGSSSEKEDTCPTCGTPVERDWQNCPTCGVELTYEYKSILIYPEKMFTKRKGFKITNLFKYSKTENFNIKDKEKKSEKNLNFPEIEPTILIKVPRKEWFKIRCPIEDFWNEKEGYKENPSGALIRKLTLAPKEEREVDFILKPQEVWESVGGEIEKLTFKYFYQNEKIAEEIIDIEVYEDKENIPKKYKSILKNAGPKDYVEVGSVVLSVTTTVLPFLI